MKKNLFLTLLFLILLSAFSLAQFPVNAETAPMIRGSTISPADGLRIRQASADLVSKPIRVEKLSTAASVTQQSSSTLSFDPPILETSLLTGTNTTLQLTLTNTSAVSITFELQEEPGGFQPNLPYITALAPSTTVSTPPEARHAPLFTDSFSSLSQPVSLLQAQNILLAEGFEGGAVPPTGWSEIVTNKSYNWEIAIYGAPHSGDFAANVEFDDKDQDEWLLSPVLNTFQATLSFWSQGSVYWCHDTYNNCDLKVWIVLGEVGGADDIYLGTAETDWTASWTWAQTTFDLTPFLTGEPFRIGFEYVGNDGAQVILDDITLEEIELPPDIPWLSETPLTGSIPATLNQVIDVFFDASQVNQAGLYTGTLHIISSDSLNPDQLVPLVMQVTDQPVVSLVSPDHGSTLGGTPVTVTGNNFKTGASVTFGGAVASNIVVVSSTQITCDTPPHIPETVDVQINNPDSHTGTLLSGFTYLSDPVIISLPDTGGAQSEIIQVPVHLANVQGLAAASFTVLFDPNILNPTNMVLGDLTMGWSLAANTSNPGEVRISMASPSETISGTGVLVNIGFEAIGAPGTLSTLDFSDILLNDGAILVQTVAGSFSVNSFYTVSGMIHFWAGGVVSDTLLTLVGDHQYDALSSQDGAYQLSGITAGNYTLTAEKSMEVDGISAYDASLTLQHDAGLITLSGSAAIAADVNKNGVVNSMDAYYILQKSVDLINLPFPGAGEVWSFSPSDRTLSNLNTNLTGQDFQAILLGDPSGNWNPAVPSQSSPGENSPDAVSGTLSLPDLDVLPQEIFLAPLTLELNSGQVYGIEIEIVYETDILTPTQVLPGSLATGWSIASNLTSPGLIRVAMAGATPIQVDGEILEIEFIASDQAGLTTDLNLTKGELNEGTLTSALLSGQVYIARPVYANFSASPITGPAPLTVSFTNLSTGDFTNSLWNFGDGSTSSATNPSHTYVLPGFYTVSLTVSGIGGSQTLVRSDYIHAYGLTLSGSLRYWADQAGIPGVALTLSGTAPHSTSSNSNGEYLISDILVGDYSLVPEKDDEVVGITAYDASLVLQHVAGLNTLSGAAAIAADADESGSIGTMDSSYILQKAVGLIDVPFPGAGAVWKFDPANRSYTNLNVNLTGQDFTGILLGDPSGNWAASESSAANSIQQGLATLSVRSGIPDQTGHVKVEILLDPAGTHIFSLDLILTYLTDHLQITSIDPGPLLTGWLFAENTAQPGIIRVGSANAQSIVEPGVLITLEFQMEDRLTSSLLQFSEGLLNEGDVPVLFEDGLVGGTQIFLPLIIK